ncbi:MAG: 3-phosphoshikimate 1-carboxyvinyltransferase [Dehalococcoidia bacterium]|nr:3-phosphoshikimate 1-carboxyvinyltransferase [Dehalococcoidia bacterium]
MAERGEVKKVTPPTHLEGEITLPGDKSISHRAVIFNGLASGQAEVSNFAPGRDCLSTVNCLRNMGVKIQRKGTPPSSHLLISGTSGEFQEAQNVLNAGNSATTMRLLAGLLSGQPVLSIITGDSSLCSRPMGRLVEPLHLMGARIWGRSNNSLAPLVIKGGPLQGIDFELNVPSAQVKSAILLAGLQARGETILHQRALSRDHSERFLQQMGAMITTQGKSISLSPLSHPLTPLDLKIPGDISSAAYFMVAGAIHPHARITLRNCGTNPTRTGIIDALEAMGARIKRENERIEGNEPLADISVETSELKGIDIGGDAIPLLIDEIPALAVAGCMARGKTTIRDAGELRVKESDRIANISLELTRMGAEIEELPDGMIIHGGKLLTGTEVESHGDHRIAMSLAIAGLVARGETIISQAGVVEISYPSFWQSLHSISHRERTASYAGKGA